MMRLGRRLVPTLGPIGGTSVRQPEGIAGETRAPAGLEPLFPGLLNRPSKRKKPPLLDWTGMPDYQHDDLAPKHALTVNFPDGRALKVNFRNSADLAELASLIGHRDGSNRFAYPYTVEEFSIVVGQSISATRRSLWYPKAEIEHYANKRYISDRPMLPKYPIYVISKGRWKNPLTAMALEECGVPYQIVVEPQEYDKYADVISAEKILVTPFSNLGQGSTPVRNWVWEHSISAGAARHWVLDDNLYMFLRFNHNLKVPVADGTIFRLAESFVDRYSNVAISGLNYLHFIERKKGNRYPPVRLNTRIYSCILIQNDIPYRWRGKYNEDTDLCIRALKDGWVTMLFNAFLADKTTTMRMPGGNTDELYAGNGWSLGRTTELTPAMQDAVLEKAETLRLMHPDIVEVKQKWGRWHHEVDYSGFRGNALELADSPEDVFDQSDDFGFRLIDVVPRRRRAPRPSQRQHAIEI